MFKNEVAHTTSCREAGSVMGGQLRAPGLFTWPVTEMQVCGPPLRKSPRHVVHVEFSPGCPEIPNRRLGAPQLVLGMEPSAVQGGMLSTWPRGALPAVDTVVSPGGKALSSSPWQSRAMSRRPVGVGLEPPTPLSL